MPTATVRGVTINYQVLGDTGPWVALSPGGRNAMDSVQSLAQRIADGGYRVVIHDRRNCGASDVVIDGDESEYEIWADDLHHRIHAMITGERYGYSVDFGSAQHLAKVFNDSLVYDGRYSQYRRARHGNRVDDIGRE